MRARRPILRSLAVPCLLAAVAAAAWGGQGAPLRQVCDAASSVTLVGLDTTDAVALFRVSAAEPDRAPWLVEVDGDRSTARLFPPPEGAFPHGGSVGPGPVFAFTSCGSDCFQAWRFAEGTWDPMGDPLFVPGGSTLHGTYDGAGYPWVVVHEPTGHPGWIRAWAWRQEGREWRSRGGLQITAVGSPGAVPDPKDTSAVLSGTGRFTASPLVEPETWVPALPRLSGGERGAVIASATGRSAYRSDSGRLLFSTEAEDRWEVSLWQPPRSSQVEGSAASESPPTSDLPTGDHRGPLAVLWSLPAEGAPELVLSQAHSPRDWEILARLPSELRTDRGEQRAFEHVLVARSGALWLLLTGCLDTSGGSGFLVRSWRDGALQPARFLPVVQGWSEP